MHRIAGDPPEPLGIVQLLGEGLGGLCKVVQEPCLRIKRQQGIAQVEAAD